jgi:ribosomal protein L3
VIARHHFKRGPKSHGSDHHRAKAEQDQNQQFLESDPKSLR